MSRRVVITGIGALTPLGVGAKTLYSAIQESRHGISKKTGDDLPTIPLERAGFIRDFQPAKFIANRKSLKVMCRDIQMAVVASMLAREEAKLSDESMTPQRSGVCIGAGVFEHDPEEMADSFLEAFADKGNFDAVKFGSEGMGRLFPLWLLKYLPNMPACHITIAHNLQGPSNTLTADSSGSMQSIEESARVIARGTADLMFCGGAECRLYGAGLLRYVVRKELRADDSTVNYPVFSSGSAGLVPGEGGAILVVESLENAQARGANILCEIRGFYAGGDISGGETEGLTQGMIRSMTEAMKRAACEPEEIDVIHLSARGLPNEEKAEAAAIEAVFGKFSKRPKLAATKGWTGFLGYSAAPIEVALAAESISSGQVIPSRDARKSPLEGFEMTQTNDAVKVQNVLVNHFESGLALHSMVLGTEKEQAHA